MIGSKLGVYMIFIEYLKNFMAGIDPVRSQIAIESKFREKLPHILEFILEHVFTDLIFKFYINKYQHGCVFNIQNNSFELTSIHNDIKKEFICEIKFKMKLNFMSGQYVTCRFDEDLNIIDFRYQMNFGSFGSNNNFYIENTKCFDGLFKRKIYFQTVSDHVITIIENLNIEINSENREFELYLSKILLMNFINPEIYRDAFHYLPSIDMDNTENMASFINEFHERYIKQDTLINQSLELIEMYNV